MTTNEVFANDREIACKSAEGKSVSAFPDVCWSPPSPAAGPVPVPYPNTAYAKDTTNGSRTVFITGKEVMLKDKSYFKTSAGDEPATRNLGMGVITGNITGKAYFTSWSMNVKIEGYNVDRHQDMMTHNHASQPGNTGPWIYLDQAAKRGDCKREYNQVERACGGQEEKEYKNWRGKTKTRWVDVNRKVKWKQKHCLGLSVKPRSLGTDELDEFKENIQSQLNDLDLFDRAIEEAKAVAINAAQDILTKMIGKAVAKKVIGAAAGPIGWAFTVVDGVSDAQDVLELKGHIDAVRNEAVRIKGVVSGLGNKIESLPGLLQQGKTGKAAETMAEIQRLIATADDCTRARKCMLVSMKSTDNRSGGMKTRGGCCPGQTGHHMIPDAYMNGAKICSGYDYDKAPVVCAEGTNQYHGSHGAMHMSMEKHVRGSLDGNKISYKDARDAAIKAHRDTFPMSFCSADCLRAQLDKYYNKACDNHDPWFGSPNPTLNYKPIGKPPTDDDLGR